MKLSEMTLIPLGTAVLAIGGGAAWMTKISYSQDSQANIVKRSEERLDSHSEYFREIRERLIRIEMEIKRGKH